MQYHVNFEIYIQCKGLNKYRHDTIYNEVRTTYNTFICINDIYIKSQMPLAASYVYVLPQICYIALMRCISL